MVWAPRSSVPVQLRLLLCARPLRLTPSASWSSRYNKQIGVLQREQSDLDHEMKGIQEKFIGASHIPNHKYIAPPEDRKLAVRHLKNRLELLKVNTSPASAPWAPIPAPEPTVPSAVSRPAREDQGISARSSCTFTDCPERKECSARRVWLHHQVPFVIQQHLSSNNSNGNSNRAVTKRMFGHSRCSVNS